jgi:hypothetical protein
MQKKFSKRTIKSGAFCEFCQLSEDIFGLYVLMSKEYMSL